MIEFSLDGRSGVSPYLQVVQQVRQALRLGLLREGDQLPTVKDVVARLAINPNTVLKAYRELERDGLVAARPGVGTFVTRTLDRRLAGRARAAAPGPARWLAKARLAGLDEESIEALFTSTFRAAQRGDSVTAVLRTEGLGKRYRRRWALSDCTLEIPAGHVTGLVGPNGAGKTTLLSLAVGLLAPDRPAPSRSAAAARPPTRPSWPRSASSPRTPRRTPGLSVADHLRLGAHLNPRWDDALARSRVERLGLDPAQRAGRLSGGQRAQLALTLGPGQAARAADPRRAGREPRPARPPRVPAGADGGRRRARAQRRCCPRTSCPTWSGSATTSSCSSTPQVRVAGDVEALLDTHHRLTGPRRDPATLPADQHVVSASHTDRQSTFVVRTDAPVLDPAWTVGRARPGGPRAGLHGRHAEPSRPAAGAGGRCR